MIEDIKKQPVEKIFPAQEEVTPPNNGLVFDNQPTHIYPYHRSPRQLYPPKSQNQIKQTYFNAQKKKFALTTSFLIVMAVILVSIPGSSHMGNSSTVKESTFTKPTADSHNQTVSSASSSSNTNPSQSSPSVSSSQPTSKNQPTSIKPEANNSKSKPLVASTYSPSSPGAQLPAATTSPSTQTSSDPAPSATLGNESPSTETFTPSPISNGSDPPRQGGLISNLLSGLLGLLF
jgi:cytoskeletal protein RodZ